MKSYVLLLVSCLPLGYAALGEIDVLRQEGVRWWRERGEVKAGLKELEAARADVKKFAGVDPALRSGALGFGDIPELKAPARGIEKNVAEGFMPYGNGLATTRAFVEALRNHTELVAEGPASARLAPWAEKRKKRDLVDLEATITRMIAENQGGQGGPLEKAYKDGTKLPEINTVLMEVAYEKITESIKDEVIRKGKSLVLVLKTTELLNDLGSREKIDQVYSKLVASGKAADLVTGRFVLVTKAGRVEAAPRGEPGKAATKPQPARERRLFWPGADYVKGSGDAFLPEDYKAAFQRALEVAQEFDAIRRGAGPGPTPAPLAGRVYVIWRGDVFPPPAPPAGGNLALPGVDRLRPVLEWIGPGADPGILIPWFENRLIARTLDEDYVGGMANEFVAP